MKIWSSDNQFERPIVLPNDSSKNDNLSKPDQSKISIILLYSWRHSSVTNISIKSSITLKINDQMRFYDDDIWRMFTKYNLWINFFFL